MLLFRPHRLLESLVLNIWHGAAVRGSEAAAQLAVYDVFVQWRADIDQQAAAAFSKARLAFPEGSQRKPRQPLLHPALSALTHTLPSFPLPHRRLGR